MKIGNEDVGVLMVRNVLGYPSTDLGTLCSCENVNIWSRYKPVRAAMDVLTDTLRNELTGFKINPNTLYLEWDKPTGGTTSPYRIGDFRGYNHDARRPTCVTIPLDLYVENESQINNYREFSFNFTLPEAETMLALANDAMVGNLDTLAFAMPNGTLFKGYMGSSQASIDDKCCAKLTDLAIGGAVSTISANIILPNSLRYDYNVTSIGQKYKIEIVPWLGNARSGDYKKAKIPGGDSVVIEGKIVSTTYVINLDAMTGDYPPAGIDSSQNVVLSKSNLPSSSSATDGSLEIYNVQMRGPIRGETTTQQARDFQDFKTTGSFRLQVLIFDKNLTLIKTIDNLLSEYPSVAPAATAGVDFSTMTYSIVIANSFTISNLGKGYSISLRANPD